MTKKIIETPLSRIAVEGGDVLHALKSNEPTYSGFGEAYFSWIKPGTIKAWKMHSKMILNLVVPIGNVRFVFAQNEGKSDAEFKEIEIGERNYSRITVPPQTWFGFENLWLEPSLVMNIANIEHDPSEVIVLPKNAFQFDWNYK